MFGCVVLGRDGLVLGREGLVFGCVVLGWFVLGRDGTDGDAGSLLPPESPALGAVSREAAAVLAASCCSARFACCSFQYAVSVALLVPLRNASWSSTSDCSSCCCCTRARAEADASLASSRARSDFVVAAARAFVAADCCAAIDSTVFWSVCACASTRAERSDRCETVPTR